MDIYLYTKTAKGGFKEYRAKLREGRGCNGGRMATHVDSNKWWTDLSPEEGVVRRCSIWFLEPNASKAKELLKIKNMDTAIDYMDKSTNAFQRSRL